MPIPSPRELAREFGVPARTAALALRDLDGWGLERAGVPGRRVARFHNRGFPNGLELIALVAPAQRRFFSVFIDHFQKEADRIGSLVVFVQQSERETPQDTLLKLFRRGFRNVVIWLDYETLRTEYIRRLRALGMNLVFFDILVESPYADCVCLDNRDAIDTLYRYVEAKTDGRSVAYVSRDIADPSSYRERSEAFRALSSRGVLWDFPWDFKDYLKNHADAFVFDHLGTTEKPSSIICSDGEVAIALKTTLRQECIEDVLLVSVDDFPECAGLGITTYRQPYEEYARAVLERLEAQSRHPDEWRPMTSRIKGSLIIREPR